MKFASPLICLAIVLLFAATSFSQSTLSPEDLERRAKEDISVNHLRQTGIKLVTKRSILWAEKDSLSAQELKDFGSLVDKGVRDIEKYTGIKLTKHFRQQQVECFLSADAGLSHTSAYDDRPYVFIRPMMVKRKTAPYLHEIAHIIARKTIETKAMWLYEGFADHVATNTTNRYGGYVSDLFNPQKKPLDQLARDRLKEDISKRILPLIGVNGPIKDEEWKPYVFIFEDRKVAAPAFYNLSESFITYFVERIGMKKMRMIFETSDLVANVKKVTGRSMDEWKAEWLKSLTE